jgi:hypothetical protein
MIRSVIAAIKNSYKPLCKQESDNLWCRGKLLISIKRAMNSSRIELLWLVWDQSRSKYYLRTMFQDGIDKPQKCRNVSIEPTASHFNIYCLHFCLISSVKRFIWWMKDKNCIYNLFIIIQKKTSINNKNMHQICR